MELEEQRQPQVGDKVTVLLMPGGLELTTLGSRDEVKEKLGGPFAAGVRLDPPAFVNFDLLNGVNVDVRPEAVLGLVESEITPPQRQPVGQQPVIADEAALREIERALGGQRG